MAPFNSSLLEIEQLVQRIREQMERRKRELERTALEPEQDAFHQYRVSTPNQRCIAGTGPPTVAAYSCFHKNVSPSSNSTTPVYRKGCQEDFRKTSRQLQFSKPRRVSSEFKRIVGSERWPVQTIPTEQVPKDRSTFSDHTPNNVYGSADVARGDHLEMQGSSHCDTDDERLRKLSVDSRRPSVFGRKFPEAGREPVNVRNEVSNSAAVKLSRVGGSPEETPPQRGDVRRCESARVREWEQRISEANRRTSDSIVYKL